MQRRLLLQAGTAAAALTAFPLVRAQSWPSGPIRIVVGFPPGGGADALARVVGEKLGTLWKQPVVIDNKPGASGTLAAEYVAQQASVPEAPGLLSITTGCFHSVPSFSPTTRALSLIHI